MTGRCAAAKASQFPGIAMAKIDTKAYRALLLQKQAEIAELQNMSADARATVTLDQSSVGRVSRIDALQRQAMAQATEQAREAELARIAAALARIDDGSYGYCLSCGEEIAEKRLQFDPAVPTCVGCAK